MRLSLVASFVVVSILTVSCGADAPKSSYDPPLARASDEGQKAIKQFRLPPGVEAKLWAAEPMLANPVSFAFDEKGRCFVAETFRLHHGVTDNRRHGYWLNDDIACRTVEDRVSMYRKHHADKFEETYEKHHDRVRMIWDSTGNGVADQSSVFADGFHKAASGIGSGVLARQGNVYYTCIPDLWLLKDTKGEHKADVRESLSYGYGVHVAFLGHDLHGLRMGPDGRLYFSCGDRGLNVKTKEGRHLFLPDCGAVLRCELDGSNLEIVATGLRNPQELAFDSYGNLFTVDNNSDSGDQARLVQIVEGGDSGWRMSFQYGTVMSDRGPWNAERIWHLENQPAYIIPPLAHITAGPSGLCFNPGGAALPDKYADHFFICDFRGNWAGSGVTAFSLRPKGASFEIARKEQFIWQILATDCDFGPDGGFYISDWTQGWDETGKGRIYRFADPTAEKKPAAAEVKKLLAEGFDQRPMNELVKLLSHADMRVRLEAQYALAAKREEAIQALSQMAKEQVKESSERFARFHALWALGQIARQRHESALDAVFTAAGDHDSEVRAQAARVMGDVDGLRGAESLAPLETLLRDPEARVRFFAAQSLGKITAALDEKAQQYAVTELRKLADDADPFVRCNVAIALSRLGAQIVLNPLAEPNAATDLSPGARMATLLAFRRQKSVGAAMFLDDADPRIVLEAARAIHDEPIPKALPFLASHLKPVSQSEFLLCRALNANFRLGKAENAAAVASFATDPAAPTKWRVEAVKMLGDWARPGPRDRLLGDSRPLPPRDPKISADALRKQLAGIMAGPDALRRETVTVAARLGIAEVADTLRKMVGDAEQSPATRVAALRALRTMKDPQELEVSLQALGDKEAPVRAEALRNVCLKRPLGALNLIESALQKGSTQERQAAFSILAALKRDDADAVLSNWLDRLIKGDVPPEIRLDLLEAAAERNAKNLAARIEAFEKSRSTNDPLARFREAMQGGDPERGRDLFLNKTELSCVRCHMLNKVGGEVGPELAGIGSKQTREYLLESLVLPDKQIAKGFDTVVLELKDGKTVTGVFKSEDAREVKVITAEGKPITVPKQQIEERRRGKSAMPEDLIQKMTKRELRDLVEFLAGLK
jgi:quinoprotein glucose dehydrogenase